MSSHDAPDAVPKYLSEKSLFAIQVRASRRTGTRGSALKDRKRLVREVPDSAHLAIVRDNTLVGHGERLQLPDPPAIT